MLEQRTDVHSKRPSNLHIHAARFYQDCTSGNETRTQNACASGPIRILSNSYTVIVPCTVRCSYKSSL